ncbi:MAG: hypothetical protein Q7T50_00005 [Candidatus Magasanikbacteria bacterium]|nr:hypothetical protein [Candidatus Magasanikbacteria bacterium]
MSSESFKAIKDQKGITLSNINRCSSLKVLGASDGVKKFLSVVGYGEDVESFHIRNGFASGFIAVSWIAAAQTKFEVLQLAAKGENFQVMVMEKDRPKLCVDTFQVQSVLGEGFDLRVGDNLFTTIKRNRPLSFLVSYSALCNFLSNVYEYLGTEHEADKVAEAEKVLHNPDTKRPLHLELEEKVAELSGIIKVLRKENTDLTEEVFDLRGIKENIERANRELYELYSNLTTFVKKFIGLSKKRLFVKKERYEQSFTRIRSILDIDK